MLNCPQDAVASDYRIGSASGGSGAVTRRYRGDEKNVGTAFPALGGSADSPWAVLDDCSADLQARRGESAYGMVCQAGLKPCATKDVVAESCQRQIRLGGLALLIRRWISRVNSTTTPHLRDEKGFSALELAAVLGIIATLIAIVMPNVSAYMRDSKITRAEADLRSIGQALVRFKQDLNRWPIFTDTEESASGGPDLRVLVGPGENPKPGNSGWVLPMMGGTRDASNQVDTLEGHLVKNLPRYPTSFVALPWQGPYLQGLKEDPWGHSYLVNVEFLWPSNFHSTESVMVLSAGPNGRVETPFVTHTGSARGDDIVYKIK